MTKKRHNFTCEFEISSNSRKLAGQKHIFISAKSVRSFSRFCKKEYYFVRYIKTDYFDTQKGYNLGVKDY